MNQNQKIKELLKDNVRLQDFYNIGPIHRAAVEDFAELIIKECIAMTTGQNQYKLGFQLAKDFSNHFGVK